MVKSCVYRYVRCFIEMRNPQRIVFFEFNDEEQDIYYKYEGVPKNWHTPTSSVAMIMAWQMIYQAMITL